MRNGFRDFLIFAGKIILVHTATYFIFGLVMSSILDYGRIFQEEIIRDFMRPIDSLPVFLGPFLQPIRGFLFALGLWPLRRVIFEEKRGWLILWGIFLVFGILGPPAAAPSSLEGLIYSRLPLWYHLVGLPEITLQTLAFSLILVFWEKRHRGVTQMLRKRALFPDILKAVVIACFAYMGYAVGSILSALLVRARIDMAAAASDWKLQMMFVVAFICNVVLILPVAQRWIARKVTLWQVFLFFWLVDTVVLLVYQFAFLSPMPLPLAALIGLFPALVVAMGISFGYRMERNEGLPSRKD